MPIATQQRNGKWVLLVLLTPILLVAAVIVTALYEAFQLRWQGTSHIMVTDIDGDGDLDGVGPAQRGRGDIFVVVHMHQAAVARRCRPGAVVQSDDGPRHLRPPPPEATESSRLHPRPVWSMYHAHQTRRPELGRASLRRPSLNMATSVGRCTNRA